MNRFSVAAGVLLMTLFFQTTQAQLFPNPASLSTGQGTPGNSDPIWTVSPWYASNPPNPMGLTFTPALINNNCAPGAWVNPASLPPPINNGNWITGASANCANNFNDGYIYFRLTLNLPSDCNGNSVATSGSYTLYLSGYADNTITDIFVNGTSTGINGGNFSSPLSITLTGPWVPGVNYVDVQVYNSPNGGNANPYGLLLVANSAASTVADGDNDGIADINDQCPCQAGTLGNGCLPTFITGDTIICAGESTTLVASGGGAYLWNTGATNDSITVSPAVTTTYRVTTTASNGYTDSARVTVVVNALAAAVINPSSIAICSGANTTLTASGGSGYNWSNAANTAAITVSPNTTTAYSVTVTNGNNCTATAAATVTVNALPTPVISPAADSVCNGQSTTLIASGGTSYAWSNAVNIATNTVSPNATTTYVVTVTDANNCSATTNAVITVFQLPVAAVNLSAAAVCQGDSVVVATTGGGNYQWNNGAVSSSFTEVPAVNTTYSVTITDANLCTASASANLIVHSLPVATINPTASAICTGSSATLVASGGVNYNWSNAANTSGITVTPVATTTYTVTVTDINTCSSTASATVTVNALPVAVVSPIQDTICFGENATFTASGGTTYLWSNNANAAGITVSPGNSASFTVTVADANLCTATAAVSLTVIPAITAVVSATDVVCFGEGNGSINLTASGGQPPLSYAWSNAEIVEDLTGLTPGNYTVTITDGAGCTTSAAAAVAEPALLVLDTAFTLPTCPTKADDGSISLNVSGGTTPYSTFWSGGAGSGLNLTQLGPGNYAVTVTDAKGCTEANAFALNYVYDFTVQAAADVTLKLGESATLDYVLNGNAGNYSAVWRPAALLSCSSCETPVTTTQVSTLYTVEVRNDVGCAVQDSVWVIVEPDYTVFVPNTFTPNGDGSNDFFRIFGNMQAVNYMQLQVFNRSGEKVFETTDYQTFWDGYYNGKPADAGVYVWLLRLSFIDGHYDDIRKGTLTLIR